MVKNNDRFAEYKKDIHKADTPAYFFQLVADFVDHVSLKSNMAKLVEGLESEYQKAKNNREYLEDLVEKEIGIKTKSSDKIASFNNREKYLKSRRKALLVDRLENEKIRSSKHYKELQETKLALDQFGEDSNKWKSWKELVMVRDFVRRNGSNISLEEYEKQLDFDVRLIDAEKVMNYSIEDIRKIYVPFFDNIYNYFADMAESDDGYITYSNDSGYGTLVIGGQEIIFKKTRSDVLSFFYLHKMSKSFENYHAFNSFAKGVKKLTSDQFNKIVDKINQRIKKETDGEVCMLIMQKENKQQDANLYKWNEKY